MLPYNYDIASEKYCNITGTGTPAQDGQPGTPGERYLPGQLSPVRPAGTPGQHRQQGPQESHGICGEQSPVNNSGQKGEIG